MTLRPLGKHGGGRFKTNGPPSLEPVSPSLLEGGGEPVGPQVLGFAKLEGRGEAHGAPRAGLSEPGLRRCPQRAGRRLRPEDPAWVWAGGCTHRACLGGSQHKIGEGFPTQQPHREWGGR